MCACVLGLSSTMALQGWTWRLDLQLHAIAQEKAAQRVDPDILIVAIDEASLAQLGRWPWPRRIHAALIERLRKAGAAGVAFDIVFSESAADDEQLANAMRDYGKVVLPVLQREQGGAIIGELRPVDSLSKAAAALGHIQMELDPDGVARSVYLHEGWGATQYPQLALALHSLDHKPPAAPADGGVKALWQRHDWLSIPFAGPPGSFKQLSYVDVLEGRVPDAMLRGKQILVGATSQGIADSMPVPGSGLGRPMAGVEVHANVLDAISHASGVSLAAPWVNALLAACLSLALMLWLSRSPARSGMLATLAVLLGVLLLAWLGLKYGHFWLAPGPSLLGCVLAYLLWSWRRLEATQGYVDAELHALRQDSALHIPAGLDPLQARISTLKAAAALGREAHQLVEAVLEHLPVGVIALHADQRLRFHNQAARQLLQAHDGAALTCALRSLRWPASLSLNEGLPCVPATALQIDAHSATGTPFLLTLAPLQTSEQAPGLIIGLADMSRVEAAQQARQDTLRFVTHDMRAPLASVISLIEAPPKGIDLLPAIRGIAQDTLALIDSLFRLSRAEAADATQFELINLIEVLHDASEACWSQARAANVRISIDTLNLDEALFTGSADLLQRALGNLLSNAIKYGGPNQSIELRLQAAGQNWRLSVSDHGPGIPPPERARLFERFSRLPSATQRGLPGSGLGLLMVRTVAERHGGRVELDFPPTGGCCFSLLLPMPRG